MDKDIEILEELISWRGKSVEIRDYEIHAIENLINRNKELKKENINLNDKLQLTKNSIKIANLDVIENYIPKSKLQKILGLEEDMTEEQILNYIDVLVSENNRLEDIEDKKVQIEYALVFNKGVKSVKNKIIEIILPTPENPISLEIQNSPMYKELIKLLENKGE